MPLVTTTNDLARRFRSDVDDPLRRSGADADIDALWSIQDVKDYMGDAADMVGRRTQSAFKTFQLPVTAGQADVALPAAYRVLDIRRARLTGQRRTLFAANADLSFADTYDYSYGRGYGYNTPGNSWVWDQGWEDRTGAPQVFIRDYTPGKLRLAPIPVSDDTLTLTATVVPAVIPGAPLPFQEPIDQHLMLLWMKKLAYSKHDADTYDPKRADRFEAEFERRVLDRQYEAERVRRAPQPVRFQW